MVGSALAWVECYHVASIHPRRIEVQWRGEISSHSNPMSSEKRFVGSGRLPLRMHESSPGQLYCFFTGALFSRLSDVAALSQNGLSQGLVTPYFGAENCFWFSPWHSSFNSRRCFHRCLVFFRGIFESDVVSTITGLSYIFLFHQERRESVELFRLEIDCLVV